MIPVSTIPETSEGKHGKETLINEHVSKEAIHEEKSTADSPPKGNPEENHQASPRHEIDDQSKEDVPKGNEAERKAFEVQSLEIFDIAV
ncbi:hypothetical protein P8452_71787 [Trifolium repens]|nr:hypothetical protein P8452_71787 [Trifolium repens]